MKESAVLDRTKESLTSSDKKKLFFNQYIPTSISPLGLSEDALKLCGFMTYRFYADENLKAWLPLSSDLLRAIIGGHYSNVVNELLDGGVWELFEHSSGATYSAKKHFCKTYRYCQPYRDEMYKRNVTKTRCSTQKVYFDKKEKKQLVNPNQESDIKDDPVINQLLQNYKDVKLIDQWQTDLWGIEKTIDAEHDRKKRINLLTDKGFAVQIGTGSINITRKNTGRLFHPAILMRRELRPYLRYKGNSVVTVDVKAAHPNFLGKFASEDDRELWIEECNSGNIYDRFVTEKTDRDAVKRAFQQAISYSPEGKSILATSIIDYIEAEFPSIYSWLSSQWRNCEINGKTLHTPQFILQSLEAKIFINKTFEPLANKFWMLPQHDGFLVERENANKLIKHLNDVACDELGFKLIITIKD